jgi:hypothetical protein
MISSHTSSMSRAFSAESTPHTTLA